MNIVIIGQGNVATNLHHAFNKKGIVCQMVSSREGLDQIPNANVYIYAVKDEALAQVAAQVTGKERALHLHTSGSMPMSVFGTDKPHAGVFYPFQTFSKAHIIEDFSRIPIFFEARGIDDISAVYSLALTITSHIYETTQHDRERLHIAGVFSCNFTNLMYTIASELLSGTHIPFKALLPLIDETAAKVHTLPPREAQTGPARRGDENVMNHHQQLLTDQSIQAIYQLLSEQIQKRS
ncbi:MAG: DUF2520 domain-containing protein [Paludibacteraceae bacterium]|jgi:predicted short-subunit dehydrogenase-like oxidoreductase (DUF2520 family)|nr:DUF2520 domain-containing protein [Paludibacteraceae bacterium]